MGGALIGMVGYLVYVALIKRRKNLSKIINIFPSKFIFENRNLKEFMLKQSKYFLRLLKKY